MTRKELIEICEKSAIGNDFGLMFMGLKTASSLYCEEKLIIADFCGNIDRLDNSYDKLFHNLIDIKEKLSNSAKVVVELYEITKIPHFSKNTGTLIVSFILSIPFDDLE